MTSTWICGFCVYEFDEIEGHKLVEQIPKSLESNFEDIKCHAFPESTVGSTVYQDDVTYSFRVRNEHSFQYATTYFKCRRDKRKSRGCIQRSLVLLSRFPFFSLFRKLLLEQIGPAFFQHGSSALEAAFTAISQWPDLNKVTSGNKISLPLFGSVLKFHAPERIQHENEIDDVSLYLMVGDTSLMWNLWEIMIAGEPLIVFGQTPEQCSEVVLSLVSIISPLISACDYRPYLSISSKVAGTIIRAHDAGDILPVVMGVTNQFWLKSLPRWPNVLVLGQSKLLSKEKKSGNVCVIEGNIPILKHCPKEFERGGKFRTSLIRRKRTCIYPRHDIIKSLCRSKRVCMDASGFIRADSHSEIENTKILRNHFRDMTKEFLKPFEKYFRIKKGGDSSIPTFRSSSFLKKDLKDISSEFGKMKRDDWLELYRRFLIGRTFKMWFLSVRRRVFE